MNYIIIGLLILIEFQTLLLLRKKVKKQLKTTTDSPVFIDTSALIDGRLLSTVQTGFIPGSIIIPRSVLLELQLLADGSDSEKRARARHGLDVASMIQESKFTAVSILDDGAASKGVDSRLLELAKQHSGSICTIDYNLNKLATAENIAVLNINELAGQLRMNHLPGEKISITVLQKGNEKNQGVGYLSDGTMVVIDGAKSDINKTIDVEFIRSLQTAAGRMLFAKKLQSPRTTSDKSSKNVKDRSKPSKSSARVKKPEDSLIELVNNQ